MQGSTNMVRPASFSADMVDATADAVADTEFSVAYDFGTGGNSERVAQEAFVVWQDRNARIYRGPTAWTASSIFLRASVASVAIRLYIF